MYFQRTACWRNQPLLGCGHEDIVRDCCGVLKLGAQNKLVLPRNLRPHKSGSGTRPLARIDLHDLCHTTDVCERDPSSWFV